MNANINSAQGSSINITPQSSVETASVKPVEKPNVSAPESVRDKEPSLSDQLEASVKKLADIDEAEILERIKQNRAEEEAYFERAVESMNQIMFRDNSSLQFSIHEDTGRKMVNVIDTQTQEIIREITPEKILNVVAGIWELAGIIVDKKA